MEISLEGLPLVENLIGILQDCRQRKSLEHAKRVHIHLCDHGLEAHGSIGNHLIPMYVDCGGMHEAHQVFNSLPCRNEYSWTSLIQGYIQSGDSYHALNLFFKMEEDSVCPSRFTMVAVLKACAGLRCIKRGREIHSRIAEEGYETDLFAGSILMDMYAKCGLLVDARDVFDELPGQDVVSWTALIAGYVEHGLGEEALKCMNQMRSEGMPLNDFTFACSLKACGSIGAIARGREMHAEIVQRGLEEDLFICNTLVDMYARCCSLLDALKVFDSLSTPDVVSWTAVMAGYTDYGLGEKALDCFKQMQMKGVSPTALTYSCCLKTCASIGAIDKGLELHSQIVKQGIEVAFLDMFAESGNKFHGQNHEIDGLEASEVILGNALVDMYGKCGSMVDAQQVFDVMPRRDLLTWTALITGYAQQGESGLVFHLFEKMNEDGLQPDEITFLSVLAVCSHAGLVDQGYKYFEAMIKEFDIIPSAEHRNCMVDLLGRAGQLNEAVVLLKQISSRPSFVNWVMILDACLKRGNLELARHAFECALRLDENHYAAYIVMSNIYANANMWEDAENVDVIGTILQVCEV